VCREPPTTVHPVVGHCPPHARALGQSSHPEQGRSSRAGTSPPRHCRSSPALHRSRPDLARAALGQPSSRRGGWEGMRRTTGPNRALAVEEDEEQDNDERHATRTHLDVESRTGWSCVGARARRYRASPARRPVSRPHLLPRAVARGRARRSATPPRRPAA
jgi:hypothetical protein